MDEKPEFCIAFSFAVCYNNNDYNQKGMIKIQLTINDLINEAAAFSEWFSTLNHVGLIGVTDGKAVGTYVEHAFQNYLNERYEMSIGSSALGIDLPSVNTDIKTTSIVQPQSSCPFNQTRQIYPTPSKQRKTFLSVTSFVVKFRVKYQVFLSTHSYCLELSAK